MIPEILQRLQQVDQKETVLGAIAILDCFLSVLDGERFEQAFGGIAHALQGAANLQIANFKADMLTVQN